MEVEAEHLEEAPRKNLSGCLCPLMQWLLPAVAKEEGRQMWFVKFVAKEGVLLAVEQLLLVAAKVAKWGLLVVVGEVLAQ